MKAKRVNILGIQIDNIGMYELIDKLRLNGGVVFTPNVDHLIKLQKNREFYRVYQEADYRVCDSQLIMFASHFLGQPIGEKVSGSDLFPAYYRRCANDESVKIFLLGGLEGVAEQARININAKVGRNMVVDTYCPPFGFENDPVECRKITRRINNSGANVLAIGVGAPKQEQWISKYRSRLKGIEIFLAIGATINFEAGNVKRAPAWMSSAGLEWLYRLALEPSRLWRRYLVEDLAFFVLVLRQKFNLNHKRNFTCEKNLFESR
ncbi:WecB/TagA/CpsF family glycosyltransferase [Pleurocapsa sp. PCC 7319]|uniref:WecB/TagA/CpsF family glycosyltransferase n=1 Tax=Pleurocapsa sp. PCC 7319 TaxID=118161 RepID=UPI00034BFEB4|nr:WecB/TagA/CpsF family glycosyltransferase [Pleurocapsa sp. PCC 7319]